MIDNKSCLPLYLLQVLLISEQGDDSIILLVLVHIPKSLPSSLKITDTAPYQNSAIARKAGGDEI